VAQREAPVGTGPGPNNRRTALPMNPDQSDEPTDKHKSS